MVSRQFYIGAVLGAVATFLGLEGPTRLDQYSKKRDEERSRTSFFVKRLSLENYSTGRRENLITYEYAITDPDGIKRVQLLSNKDIIENKEVEEGSESYAGKFMEIPKNPLFSKVITDVVVTDDKENVERMRIPERPRTRSVIFIRDYNGYRMDELNR